MQSTDISYEVKETCVGYVLYRKYRNGSYSYVGLFETKDDYMKIFGNEELS